MKTVDESILFILFYFLFYLWFISQNYLSKLSTFHGYKGIYSRVYEECEESVTIKQGILVTQPHDWNKSQV